MQFPADWWVDLTLQNKVKHAASSISVSTALVIPAILKKCTIYAGKLGSIPRQRDERIGRSTFGQLLGDWRRYAWMPFINSFSQDEDFLPIPSIISHNGFPPLTLLCSCLRCKFVTSLLVHWSVHAEWILVAGFTRENWVRSQTESKVNLPLFIEGSIYITTPTYYSWIIDLPLLRVLSYAFVL